jgi:hypothetical protein
MARPHIEFIQNQVLPWKQLGQGASRPGASGRALSYDPETKAASVILKYPAGWRMPEDHYLPCDEELFVLEGTFTIGGVAYHSGDYAYLPAGMPRPGMASDQGAAVLTFFEGPHGSAAGDAPLGLYDPAKLIAKIETAVLPWGAPSDPVVAATANAPGRKLLRQDPRSGERTWMLRFGPDDPNRMTHGRVEIHPVVEEVFLLDGEIQMPCGVLNRGAYFWRPAGIPHGPVGTLKGLSGFFRCKGGPLVTEWSTEEKAIDWHPAYRPTLPDHLKPLAAITADLSALY